MDNTTSDEKFNGWVILELMGHRRLIGFLSEHEIAGSAFLRIDVLTDPPTTQFYAAGAVYCITPTTEEMARRAAKLSEVAPIKTWEMPKPLAVAAHDDDEAGDDEYEHPF